MCGSLYTVQWPEKVAVVLLCLFSAAAVKSQRLEAVMKRSQGV